MNKGKTPVVQPAAPATENTPSASDGNRDNAGTELDKEALDKVSGGISEITISKHTDSSSPGL